MDFLKATFGEGINIINGNVSAGSNIVMINGQIVSGDPVIEGSNNVISKEVSIELLTIDTLIYDLSGNIEININPELKGKEYLMIEGEDNIINAMKIDSNSNALDFTLDGMIKLN